MSDNKWLPIDTYPRGLEALFYAGDFANQYWITSFTDDEVISPQFTHWTLLPNAPQDG